mmetsp:Transcript_9545/g.21881  ORF Transcript_9545/g.21881 Transcript_9545/m.21881 type:complete len:172 (-) Transcript_9545:14-529(-)
MRQCSFGLATVCAYLSITAALLSPKAVDSSHPEAFFGRCLSSVQVLSKTLNQEPQPSVSSACANSTVSPQLGVTCAQLAGRVSEALEEGYIADGKLLCGELVQEDAKHKGTAVSGYAPVQDTSLLAVFCDVMGVDQDVSRPCEVVRTGRPDEAHRSAAWGNLVALLHSSPS